MMTPRIQKLRQNSLDAINTISAERAVLITEFYKSPEARQVSIRYAVQWHSIIY